MLCCRLICCSLCTRVVAYQISFRQCFCQTACFVCDGCGGSVLIPGDQLCLGALFAVRWRMFQLAIVVVFPVDVSDVGVDLSATKSTIL